MATHKQALSHSAVSPAALNIRTRDLPASQNHAIQQTLVPKRKLDIVDLTWEDENNIDASTSQITVPPRKRSRSASDSDSNHSLHLSHQTQQKPSTQFSTTAITAANGSIHFRSRLDATKARGHPLVVSARRDITQPKAQPTPEEQQKRRQFLQNISKLNDVTLRNDIDNDSPPVEFQFVEESVLGKDVFKAPEDFMIGCDCQKKHKQRFGCVYLDSCTCIEDSTPDEHGKKSFVYSVSDKNYRCLRSKALSTRNHIYECNSKCDCTELCKNRVVQHGRQVPVQIFKTKDRGWGLCCLQDLQKGQFIETYRGEIIKSEEADRRGEELNEDVKNNFFYDFDKFAANEEVFDKDRAYTCDGRYFGSPARFINHSCDPNCAIFTVSYNHNDRNIYELAFFALEDIPKHTELTFDYYDNGEATTISDEEAREFEIKNKYAPTKCLCGSKYCRGYFLH